MTTKGIAANQGMVEAPLSAKESFAANAHITGRKHTNVGENKIKIHAIQTGTVDIKTAHRVRKLGGLIRVFTDSRWTEWFSPEPIALEPEIFGPFEESYKVTKAGDVLIVPTPGHTPGHV